MFCDTCVAADDSSVPYLLKTTYLLKTNWVTMPGHTPGKATWLMLNLGIFETGSGDDGSFLTEQVLAKALAQGWRAVYSAGSIRGLTNDQPVSAECQNYLRSAQPGG